MKDNGPISERTLPLGMKLGLTAMLMFIVASALVWHHVYRDPVALAHSRPDSDRLLVVRVDGPTGSETDLAPPRRQDRGRERQDAVPPDHRRAAPPPPPPEPPPAGKKYEVRRGDCLSTIAGELYGTSTRWREIAEANEMAPPYLLKEGMILDIP